MKPSRAWPCIVALALLAPSALAASALQATSLRVTGATSVSGDAHALLLTADVVEFSWHVLADAMHMTREHATMTAGVSNPLNPDAYLVSRSEDWQVEESDFTTVTLGPRGVLPGGALLAVGAGEIEVSTTAALAARSVTDPVLAQGPPPESQGEEGDGGEIVRRVDGRFIELVYEESTLVMRGDITLVLYGPGYVIESAEGNSVRQTGEFETTRAGPAAQGRQERHTLTLTNAVLTVHAPGGATLLATSPRIQMDGTLLAQGASGALSVDGLLLTPDAQGALIYTGKAALDLATSGGRVQVAPPAALATTALTVDQGPRLLPLTAAALAALAILGAAGALLWQRRARPEEDLELALLAMDERRWDDALPRLARVAKARPHDAGVLVDRALCLENVGRLDEAASGFETALRRAPRHAEAHFYYARTLVKLRQREAARAHLEAALEHDPRLVELARGEPTLRGL